MENQNLPYDELSERAVLGAMLVDENYIASVFATLREEHFYDPAHREIFKAIGTLSGNGDGIDIWTVSSHLKRTKRLEYARGREYVAGLIDGIPERLHLRDYIKNIINSYISRQVIKIGNEMIKNGSTPGNEISNILNQSHEALSKIEDTFRSDEPTFLERIEKLWENYSTRDQSETQGYKLTKFKSLEKKLNGIQPGNHVIAGESSKGKTAVLIAVQFDIIESNPEISCLYFSLDDSADRTFCRFLAVLTGVDIKTITGEQPNESQKNLLSDGFRKLQNWLKNGRLEVSKELDINSLKRIVATAVRKNPKTVVFIDSLNLLKMDGFAGLERDEQRMIELRRLFVRHNIPIFGTFEVRKKTQGSKTRRLKMDDLLGSTKTAYNSEVIFLLQPKDENSFSSDPQPLIEINIVKNKISGVEGKFHLQFDRATTNVIEVELKKKESLFNVEKKEISKEGDENDEPFQK